MRLLDKIDSYLADNILESYSKEMIKEFNPELLKRLSADLSNWLHIDISKSTFEEIDAKNPNPAKIRDKIVICFYKYDKTYDDSYIIIGHDEEGKSEGVIVRSDMRNKRAYVKNTKKSAIENADRIFIVKKEGYVSNFGLKQDRMARKEGAVALDRYSDENGWYTKRDKSGYDVGSARKALNDRLYAKQKDERTQKILRTFNEMSVDINNYVTDLANGKIPEWEKTRKIKEKIKTLLTVVDTLSLYKNNIPEYVAKDLEKALGI